MISTVPCSIDPQQVAEYILALLQLVLQHLAVVLHALDIGLAVALNVLGRRCINVLVSENVVGVCGRHFGRLSVVCLYVCGIEDSDWKVEGNCSGV